MKLLLLFSFFLYSYGAVSTKEELLTMAFKVFAEYPRLDIGLEQTGCQGDYCRFEDKNGCKQKCNEYIEMRDMTKKLYETWAVTESECVSRCIAIAKKEAGPVCESLCAIHFSYPDREEYEQIAMELLKDKKHRASE